MACTAGAALCALATRTMGTMPISVMNARISWDVMIVTLSCGRTSRVETRYSKKLTPQANSEQQKQPPRVSVVVVSRNRAAMLRRCLETVAASDAHSTLQVIVVDNGSTDGSAWIGDDFPNVQVIRLPKNFGLTKALNLGWRAADAEYVFFLHDDTEVRPPTIAILAGALDTRAEVAAVCPLLADGH